MFLFFVFRFLLQLVNNSVWFGYEADLHLLHNSGHFPHSHKSIIIKTGKSPTKCSIAWKMCFRFKDHVVIIWCIPGTTWSRNNSNNWLLDFFQSSTTMMFELISNYRHKNAQRLFMTVYLIFFTAKTIRWKNSHSCRWKNSHSWMLWR